MSLTLCRSCTSPMSDDASLHHGGIDCWTTVREKIDLTHIVNKRWTRQRCSLGLTAMLSRFASRNVRQRRTQSPSPRASESPPKRGKLEQAFSALNLRSLDTNQDGRVSPTEVHVALQAATAESEGGLNEAHPKETTACMKRKILSSDTSCAHPGILAQLDCGGRHAAENWITTLCEVG